MGGPTRLPAGRTRIAHACGGARLMRFRRVPLNDVDWAELDRFADRTHAQRLPWLNYLTATGAGQPLVALLEDKGKTIGCFTALRGKRLGLPVDRTSTRLNSSHYCATRMPSSDRTKKLYNAAT